MKTYLFKYHKNKRGGFITLNAYTSEQAINEMHRRKYESFLMLG